MQRRATEASNNCNSADGQAALYQLEQESKAHDKWVWWQEILLPPDHEGPYCQVLSCRCSLGHLRSIGRDHLCSACTLPGLRLLKVHAVCVTVCKAYKILLFTHCWGYLLHLELLYILLLFWVHGGFQTPVLVHKC